MSRPWSRRARIRPEMGRTISSVRDWITREGRRRRPAATQASRTALTSSATAAVGLTGYGDHRWSSTGSGQGTNSDGVDSIHRLARGARAAFLSQVNIGVLIVVIVEAA